MRTCSTRSFILLRQRSKVLLPHPEGPISAVMRCLGSDREMSLRASASPYQRERDSISTIGTPSAGGEGRWWAVNCGALLVVIVGSTRICAACAIARIRFRRVACAGGCEERLLSG